MLPGVTIDRNGVVGAGSVDAKVVRDLAAVCGNLARALNR